MVSNNFNPKKPKEYICETCDFNTCNKKDYTRHIKTIKHIKANSQCFSIQNTLITPYHCACGKKYVDTSGLWRHKKVCNYAEPLEKNEGDDKDKELIMMLIKQNSEMLEIIKNIMHVIAYGIMSKNVVQLKK